MSPAHVHISKLDAQKNGIAGAKAAAQLGREALGNAADVNFMFDLVGRLLMLFADRWLGSSGAIVTTRSPVNIGEHVRYCAQCGAVEARSTITGGRGGFKHMVQVCVFVLPNSVA